MQSFNETGHSKWNGWRPWFQFFELMMYLAYALCFYVGALFVHEGKSTFKDVFRVKDTHWTSFTDLHKDILLSGPLTCLVIGRFTLL